uniref:Cytochrome P450 n=1 Tax=Haemonchus placei TaxID=6290 RepID=A0A0N4VY12_HAEPC
LKDCPASGTEYRGRWLVFSELSRFGLIDGLLRRPLEVASRPIRTALEVDGMSLMTTAPGPFLELVDVTICVDTVEPIRSNNQS